MVTFSSYKFFVLGCDFKEAPPLYFITKIFFMEITKKSGEETPNIKSNSNYHYLFRQDNMNRIFVHK